MRFAAALHPFRAGFSPFCLLSALSVTLAAAIAIGCGTSGGTGTQRCQPMVLASDPSRRQAPCSAHLLFCHD